MFCKNSWCTGLTSVTIPNSVTSIGKFAFWYCSGLTSVYNYASTPQTLSSSDDFSNAANCTLYVPVASVDLYKAADQWKDFGDIKGLISVVDTKATGLITEASQLSSPYTDTTEGKDLGALIDGNVSTYWHSNWHGGSVANGVHYLQVNVSDMPEKFGFKFTRRNVGYDQITRWAVYGVPADNLDATKDECTLLASVTTNYDSNTETIYSQVIDNSQQFTTLRFYEEATSTGRGYFHLAEFQLYPCKYTYNEGDCGDNLTWTLSEDGALTIAGTGDMYKYADYKFPWYEHKDNIKSLVVEDGVTSIERYAFKGYSSLTSVTIGNSVTSIGSGAFDGCRGLTSVTIGNSVTSIGDYAFIYCTGLTSVTIPNSVISIGMQAFEYCSDLTSATIGNSVTSIGKYIFSYCTGLTSLTVSDENTTYDSRDNCNAIIETSSNTLISGCKNTVIPNSVTSIGSAAFYDCIGLTSIEIPNSVTSIGDDAFSCCPGLTSIEINNSVTSIGDRVFTGCTSLTSIIVEDGNAIYDSRDNCNAIIETSSNTLIAGCKNTVIPNSVTSIESNAFSACFGLTSITIPESVKSIGSSAFSDCTGLTSITIPNSVTSIGSSAFYNCSALTSVYNYASTPQTLSTSFDFSNAKKCTLYVPYSSISSYSDADYWKEFKDIKIFPVELALTDANPTLVSDAYDVDKISYTRKLTNNKYATFCLPYDIDLSQYTDYFSKVYVPMNIALYKTDGMLLLLLKKKDMTETMPAGTAFIALSNSDETVSLKNSVITVLSESTPNPDPTTLSVFNFSGTGGSLYENTDLEVKIGGSYKKMVDLDENYYRAFNTAGQFGPTEWLNPFRMYVYKNDGSSNSRITDIVLSFDDDDTTDIEQLMQKASTTSDAIYNIHGQKVNSADKGLYIINGKKVIK